MRPVELALNARYAAQPDAAVPVPPSAFGPARARNVRGFHAGFPEYSPTPLCSLAGLAARLGLGRVLVRGASASDPLTGFLRD